MKIVTEIATRVDDIEAAVQDVVSQLTEIKIIFIHLFELYEKHEVNCF